MQAVLDALNVDNAVRLESSQRRAFCDRDISECHKIMPSFGIEHAVLETSW